MNVTRFARPFFSVCCFLASLGSAHTYGQVALYDNTGNGPTDGPQLDPGDRYLAQQFLTGAYDNVSSVSVNLRRNGAPTGQINLSIWDADESGKPGNTVGTLGVIDVGSLSRSYEFVTFEKAVTGLDPQTPYYFVLDFIDAALPISFGTFTSDEGTNGASKLLFGYRNQDRWPTLDSILGSGPGGARANYLQMLVEAMPTEIVSPQIALYDNMELEPLFQFDDVIGLRFDDRTEPLAQQLRTGESNNLTSVSLFLQRVGSPTGKVAIEIWDDGGSGVPSTHVATVGSFDVASLSSSEPEVVTLDALVTGLEPQSSYYVVFNNRDTDISAPSDSYRFGLLGRVDDEQDEGTNGAEHLLGSFPSGTPWTPVTDLLGGCHPSGACTNYLRMSVMSASRLGDFDENGVLDVGDIDLLSEQLRTAPDDRSFDLNNDQMLTNADREVWVQALAGTFFGDADVNGEVGFSDFLQLSEHFGQEGGWGQGDFDGNGLVEFPDFLALSVNFSGAPNGAAAAVPEPAGVCLAMFGVLGLIGTRRRR